MSAASRDAAAAAKTEEPTLAYSRPPRDSRTTRPLQQEKGTEARRPAPARGEGERGLHRERESGIGNLAVSAMDSITRSKSPHFSDSLKRKRSLSPCFRGFFEGKSRHVGDFSQALLVSELLRPCHSEN